MKITIDRSRLRCGGSKSAARGIGPTELLNEQGFMCCLGQIGLAMGVSREALRGAARPSDITSEVADPADFELLRYLSSGPGRSRELNNTDLADSAMFINDDESIGDAQRESELVELFDAHFIELEFTGTYVTRTDDAQALNHSAPSANSGDAP